jgi:hypothetical protein
MPSNSEPLSLKMRRGDAERTQNEIGECSDRVGCAAARDDLGHHEAGEALDDRDRESAAEFVADVKRVDLPFGQSDRDAVAFDVAEVAGRARARRVDALARCAAADRVLDLRVHSGHQNRVAATLAVATALMCAGP